MMPHNSRCTIVVPCYNEAQRLDIQAIQGFISQTLATSLLFVDDGSTDATLPMLKKLHAFAPDRIGVLKQEVNRGKAEAVRCGVIEATKFTSDYIAFWDADMATPLAAVPHFSSVLDRYPSVQIAWGTRLTLLGRRIHRNSTRRVLGRIFSHASALAVGIPIHDALCGAKMFRKGPWLDALFGSPFESRWIFDVEILSRLRAALRHLPEIHPSELLFEIPLDVWNEIEGSKLRSRDFLRAGNQLAALLIKTRLLHHEAVSVTTMLKEFSRGENPISAIQSGSPLEYPERKAA